MDIKIGEFYQHRYGGLYVPMSIGKSTVDRSEQVIYIHIFPFDRDVWVRPMTEWVDGRFTLLTVQEATEIQKYNREEFKVQIATAKSMKS